MPTAMNPGGAERHTTSSTSGIAASSARLSGAPTGIASTTDAAPSSRATRLATRAVAPVATPSSTITAVRPVRSTGGSIAAEPSHARLELRTLPLLDGGEVGRRTAPWRSTSSLSTRAPRSPMAPIATSGWLGSPSLRTTSTSSGAWSADASSAATGTPPRGRPSTTGRSIVRPANACASRRPASRRSVKWSISRGAGRVTRLSESVDERRSEWFAEPLGHVDLDREGCSIRRGDARRGSRLGTGSRAGLCSLV